MSLTTRQRQIVATLAKTGGSNKAIGARLGIAEATVKSHMGQIYQRLGCKNRTQVALWAR